MDQVSELWRLWLLILRTRLLSPASQALQLPSDRQFRTPENLVRPGCPSRGARRRPASTPGRPARRRRPGPQAHRDRVEEVGLAGDAGALGLGDGVRLMVAAAGMTPDSRGGSFRYGVDAQHLVAV